MGCEKKRLRIGLGVHCVAGLVVVIYLASGYASGMWSQDYLRVVDNIWTKSPITDLQTVYQPNNTLV